MNQICEKCSMSATHTELDSAGVVHYFCEHHSLVVDTPHTHISPKKLGIKDFLPLIIIFSIIIIFTTTTTLLHTPFEWSFAMRMMMGSFFTIFGLFKIFNLKPFADAYQTYDIIAMRSKIYSYLYPFFEILIAILYLADIGGVYRDIFTFVLMMVSSIGVIIKLKQKEEVPCACLGMVFKLPMTKVTLVEDLLMSAEALFMIILNL